MIRDLKQKRAKMWADMQALSDRAKTEKRSLTADEQEQWDNMDAELVSMRNEIERLEREDQLKKEFADKQDERKEQPKKVITYEDAFTQYAKRGLVGMSQDHRLAFEKRGTSTQVTTTDGLGGYLVPDTWADSIVQYMKQYGGVLDVANVIQTAQGGTFHVPTINDTGTSAAKFAEDTAVTVQDLTFTEVTLDSYIYASTVLASYAMLEDSAYDLPSFINEQLGIRIGRIVNNQLTVGDGTGDPNGVVTATSAGKTTASGTAITRDEIVDLVHSVDRAYRLSPNCRFMMNDSTLAYIKKLAIGSADDRPLWQPSMRVGEPDTLEGFPITINNDMAAIALNAKTILFGDFNKYYVRQVGGIGLQRLNERYADKLVVGFLGWLRIDGDLVDTTAIKHLLQAAA